PGLGGRPALAPPRLRSALGRVRAPRHPGGLPRRWPRPAAERLRRGLPRLAPDVAHLLALPVPDVGLREPRRRRALGPLPAPARRPPRGDLLVGAVPRPPARGPVRGLRRPPRDRALARPAAGLPRELLRLDRGRREARAPLRRRVRRSQRRL